MSSKRLHALNKLQYLNDEEDKTIGDYTYFVVRSKKPQNRMEGIVAAAAQNVLELNPGKVDHVVEKKGDAYHIGFHKRYAQDLSTWNKLTEYVRDLA